MKYPPQRQHTSAQIVVVGVSHRTAPLHVRERLAFAPADITSTLERLAPEGFILSTCNRVEIYGLADHTDLLLRGHDDLRHHVYRHQGDDAVRHLFRVAAGLDSMVLGEHEIFAQVRKALAVARDAGALGPVLGRLSSAAVHAARRARNETALGRCPASVVTLALSEAAPTGKSILVVGAGALGETVLQRLGPNATITSRTDAHAASLAQKHGARLAPWHDRFASIASADLVIACTSAPHPIIHQHHARPGQVFIDLGVPRDVHSGVRNVARVIDMDELQALANRNRTHRAAEAERAETILAQLAARFAA